MLGTSDLDAQVFAVFHLGGDWLELHGRARDLIMAMLIARLLLVSNNAWIGLEILSVGSLTE